MVMINRMKKKEHPVISSNADPNSSPSAWSIGGC